MNRRTSFRSAVVLCAALLGSVATVEAATPCPPDINCSGTVNVQDLLLVIGAWGDGPGSPSDVDGSGLVNVGDLLEVIGAWGPCVFEFTPYPDAEAHQIGLEILGSGGALSLSQDQYNRIVSDVAAIRAAYPALAGQIHSQAWATNQMLVELAPGQPQGDYNCANAFYQLTSSQVLFGNWRTLTFAGKYNVPALVEKYIPLAAVNFAEPNGMIGGQNFWRPTPLPTGMWRWEIDDGFWDCFDGCDCHTYYVLETDAKGHINQISITQQGQPWCEF